MKKNILLAISIILVIGFIVFFRVQIFKEEPVGLKGQKIDTGIYEYDLHADNQIINGITLIDDKIYYLTFNEDIEEYNLNILDIINNQTQTISKQIIKDNYCYIDENINCISDNSFSVYNFKFELLFNYTIDKSYTDDYFASNYFPYKDTYLSILDNEIYLIQANELKLFKTIDNPDLIYLNYYQTADNTILLLTDLEDNYYFYNINENELTLLDYNKYSTYPNGYIFYNENTYEIYDLKNAQNKTYDNKMQRDYYYVQTYYQNTLYSYDIINDELLIENLAKNTIKIFDVTKLSTDNPIDKIFIDDNYLYIYLLQDIHNFYVIDLAEVEIPENDIAEYQSQKDLEISQKINNIKDNYALNINIKEKAIINYPDFSAEAMLDNQKILQALDEIETIVNKYDQNFFNYFKTNGYKGLNIYLTGDLTPSDYETQAANPAAYSLVFNDEYMIVIDINQDNIAELLCHELMHNMEFSLNNANIYPFSEWYLYNPQDFYYNDSYTKDYIYNYTLSETNINNVYFVDYYSHTFDIEDRARIFEKVCACDETSYINDYPHLYAKAQYLKAEILNYFPTLANTKLFSSLND